MPTASSGVSILFTTLVMGMSALVVAVLRRVSREQGRRATGWSAPTAFLLAYLVGPALLAASGLLDQYEPVPTPMVVVMLLTGTTIAAGLSPLGKQLAASVSLAALVGFQAFRIPVELLLHRLSSEGVIPVAMTFSGLNFDVLSGLSAAILGVTLARRAIPRRVVLAWNVASLLLLATIVVIATLATPIPSRSFVEGPPNLLPSTFPFVWLPTVLVQIALFGHMLVFQALRRDTAT